MAKKLNDILDPRGIQDRQKIKLAKRPTLDELKKGKILFYNNTKLGFCNYYTVFDRIKEHLTELGITNFVEYTETVRGKNAEKLAAYAAMLAKEKPTAAIVAFGDMGTSPPPPPLLQLSLEKLGIPSVYMTAPPGTGITQGVGVYRAGHLCMASVDIMQFTTVEDVAAEVDKKWDYIIGSLTTNGPELDKLAEIPFKMDKVAPAANGLLPLADKIVVDDAKLVEPGCYMEEIMDFFNDEHISDGLPIIPPTKARYEKMMEYCPWDENTVLTDPTGPDRQMRHCQRRRHCRYHGRL